MQNYKVTFQDLQNNQKLIVDLEYDPNTTALDFKVTPDPDILDMHQDLGMIEDLMNKFFENLFDKTPSSKDGTTKD